MKDPRTVNDPLKLLAELAAAMHHGRAAFEQRLDEMGAGYPSAGEGAPGNAANGGPTAAMALTHIRGGVLDKEGNPVDPKKDPAEIERKAFDRHIAKALEDAGQAWAIYQRTANERLGVSKLKDPGCDLCAQVPCGNSKCARCPAIDARHYCAVYGSVTVTESGPRGTTTERTYKLCVSCHDFQRPRCAGRLPSHDEVLDHVEGRKRRWKAG